MTRPPRTRSFPHTYSQRHPHVTVSDGFAGHAHPIGGGGPVMNPMPVGLNGQPYNGMDPSNPVSWVRPWNPAPGMIGYLNFDGAKAQATAPTGVSRPAPQSDRRVRRRVRRTGGRG